MNKLIFFITIIFFLNACSHKVTYKTCAGPSNPQQEYHSLNSFIGSVFPPAVLLTTPFFLLQTQKNMNFADNETLMLGFENPLVDEPSNGTGMSSILNTIFLFLQYRDFVFSICNSERSLRYSVIVLSNIS